MKVDRFLLNFGILSTLLNLGFAQAQDFSSELQTVGANLLQTKDVTGKGVGVAIIDTGIYDVNKLPNTYGSNTRYDITEDGCDYETAYTSGNNGTSTSSSHGTQMAKAICKIAPDATIYSMEVSNSTSFGLNELDTGLSEVLAKVSSGEWDVDVINLSVANSSVDTSCNYSGNSSITRAIFSQIKSTIATLVDDYHIVVVAGTGNDGKTYDYFPACLDDVISATGSFAADHSNFYFQGSSKISILTGGDCGTKSYSPGDFLCNANYSSTTDFIVPGGAVYDTGYRGVYDSDGDNVNLARAWSGTSLSSAILSGMVALLCEFDPSRCWNAKEYLTKTATTFTYNGINIAMPNVKDASVAMLSEGYSLHSLLNGTGDEFLIKDGLLQIEDFTFNHYNNSPHWLNNSVSSVSLPYIYKSKFLYLYELDNYNENFENTKASARLIIPAAYQKTWNLDKMESFDNKAMSFKILTMNNPDSWIAFFNNSGGKTEASEGFVAFPCDPDDLRQLHDYTSGDESLTWFDLTRMKRYGISNDEIASVVLKNCNIMLYKDDGFSGKAIILNEGQGVEKTFKLKDLSPNLKDEVSSFWFWPLNPSNQQ